jgi:NDP-sugar pyrophosphorylase family protein
MLRDVDSLVDNIFIRNRSQSIEYLIEKALKETKTAVILADNKKSLKILNNRYSLKVDHSTIVEKAIKKLSDSGFRNIFIVADHKTLTNIFKIVGNGNGNGVKIEYIDEEVPEGSASALKLLSGKIKTAFLVAQCDLVFEDVNLVELWQRHLQEKNIVTLLVSSSITHPNNVLFCQLTLEGNRVISYLEKPLLKKLNSSIFFGGIFIAEPELLSYPGRSLELDIFPELARKGILGGQVSSAEHLHVHTREDLLRVRKQIKNGKKKIKNF